MPFILPQQAMACAAIDSAVKGMPLPIDTKEGELQKELRSEILLMRSFTHRNVSALHAAAHAHPCTRRRTHTHAHAPYSL